MEVNINILKGQYVGQYSASVAELGDSAASMTWNASKRFAAGSGDELLTPEQCEAFRREIGSWGAWDAEERAAMSHTELRALFVQHVMGEVREAGADRLEDIDWAAYEADAEKGRVSGFLFRAENGDVYAYVGE